MKIIYVYADWIGIETPTLMGSLLSEKLRGKEVFSFEYDKEWLKSKHSKVLDPDLLLYEGKQYLNAKTKRNFGLFTDSAPDRWGRLLIKKREAIFSKLEGREQKKLFESDYLLGVHDLYRVGGLRFKTDPNGMFLSCSDKQSVPPSFSSRHLEQMHKISLEIEKGHSGDGQHLEYLNFIAPGSSLGGARPKATIIDNEKNLWIAKFPSKNDVSNSEIWEIFLYQLAINTGIEMSESQIKKVSDSGHGFLTKRFDRTKKGKRVHFASAMTLLGYADGDSHQVGVIYFELADFIKSKGSHVEQDLIQLWKRIVFNVCVSNTDDHLRNHGFLLNNRGWKLSPAYDLNPNEDGLGLTLNISENDNSLNLDLAISVSEYFGLNLDDAKKAVTKMTKYISNWTVYAKKIGLSRNEIEMKSNAFNEAVLWNRKKKLRLKI